MQIKEEVIVPEGEGVVVLDETQTELELIKKKTREQLVLLRKQTERLQLFDANIDVDLLIKWYELKSSQFSQLACAYGQKNWYDRQVLHVEVITGAIVLGLTVHALAFFLMVGAYYKLSELLSEHYNAEETYKEAIRERFSGLRDELKQSIETFNEMERKIDDAFASLEEQSVDLSTKIAQLSIEAGKLHHQVARLETMAQQLQEQQQNMLSTTVKLSDAGENLGKEIDALSATLLEKKVAMDLMSDAIVSVVDASLRVEEESMDDSLNVDALLERSKKQIEVIDEQTEKLKRIESAHDTNKASLILANELMLSLKESRAASANCSQEANELIQKSQAIHERARRAIALKQNAVPERGPQ